MIQSTMPQKRRRERFPRFPHANEWGGGEGGKGEICGKVRDSKQGFQETCHVKAYHMHLLEVGVEAVPAARRDCCLGEPRN